MKEIDTADISLVSVQRFCSKHSRLSSEITLHTPDDGNCIYAYMVAFAMPRGWPLDSGSVLHIWRTQASVRSSQAPSIPQGIRRSNVVRATVSREAKSTC